MSTTTVTAADLRPIDLFDDLDDALLAEWAALARPQRADAGTVIVEQGAQSPGLILLFEGTIQTARCSEVGVFDDRILTQSGVAEPPAEPLIVARGHFAAFGA